MKLFESIRQRIQDSVWAPLALKIVLGTAGLVLLGALGSGAFDRFFASATAHASDEKRPPPAVATASASASPSASAAPAPPAASASSSAPPAGPRADGKIVLATATQADLEKLPGIGPGKAKKILELRDKLGRFKKLEDLYRIKGIKRRLIEKIRPLVVLDDEPPGKP